MVRQQNDLVRKEGTPEDERRKLWAKASIDGVVHGINVQRKLSRCNSIYAYMLMKLIPLVLLDTNSTCMLNAIFFVCVIR